MEILYQSDKRLQGEKTLKTHYTSLEGYMFFCRSTLLPLRGKATEFVFPWYVMHGYHQILSAMGIMLYMNNKAPTLNAIILTVTPDKIIAHTIPQYPTGSTKNIV